MTLEEYEARIERWERLEVGPIPVDGDGQPCYESPGEAAAAYLAATAREIRAIAWQPPFQSWARGLTARAIASADRIAHEHGKIGGYSQRLS